MKKILITTCALLLIAPSLCSADYLIVFKNGGKLKATDISLKGSVLYLEALGGTIGVPKDNIKYIQEIASSKPKSQPAPNKDVAQNGGVEGVEGGEEGKDEENTVVAEQEEDPTKRQKERKAYLIKKLKRHYRLFKKEITKNNKLQIRKRIAYAKDRQEQLIELEVDVRSTNGGTLPPWWSTMPVPEPPAGL